jgi:hypothetical protein
MKRLLLITLFVSATLVKGQPSCSSTYSVGDIFYPNTVSTPTFATNGFQFLCGPNTVVYDTISLGMLLVYVNTGSTLYYLKGDPRRVNFIWLKNNSTLNVMAGCAPVTVYYEPFAIINNPASVPIGSVACTSITFPAIDCSAGINEQNKQGSIFTVYPNPSSSQITIEVTNFKYKTADISFFNQFGELVLRKKDWLVSEKELNINSLSNGIYFIQIKTNQEQQTEKLIIDR